MGSTIIMGRTTFDSIGKPLPGRRNIVLSRNPNWEFEGVETMSVEQVLSLGKEEDVFVIGGGQIYEIFISSCDSIELTIIDTIVEGADSWFPETNDFTEITREECPAGEHDDNDMIFVRLER